MIKKIKSILAKSKMGLVRNHYFGIHGGEFRGAAHGTNRGPLTIALLDKAGSIVCTTTADRPCDRPGIPPRCGFSIPLPLAWLHEQGPEIKFSFRIMETGVEFPKEGRVVEKKRLHKFAQIEDLDLLEQNDTLEDALTQLPPDSAILVMAVHELERSGAPLIALSLAKNLSKEMGVSILTLCLGGSGPLAREFAHLGPVVSGLKLLLKRHPQSTSELLREIKGKAHPAALANSLASAPLVAALNAAGFRVVSLVHEYPFAFAAPFIDIMMAESSEVIFPCEDVRGNFETPLLAHSRASAIIPQGVYMLDNDGTPGPAPVEISGFREKLGIGPEENLVLACGTVDARKGFDWFTSFVLHFSRHSALSISTHFAWLGKIHDKSLYFHCRHTLDSNGAGNRFHHIGEMEHPAIAYAAADMLIMCSRIDPFPSVVLEALASGRPVMGFDVGQGTSGLIQETGFGEVIRAMDMEEACLGVERILGNDGLRAKVAAEGPALIRQHFTTSAYSSRIAEKLRFHAASGHELENASSPDPADRPNSRRDFARAQGVAGQNL